MKILSGITELGQICEDADVYFEDEFERALTTRKLDLIDSMISTTVETKRENWQKFSNLISNQFEHGGYKYAHSREKESTDLICEFVPGETGVDWILGTIIKYVTRYKNFKREKDLLKIATYCYICWLKMGNHLKEEHDEDIKK